MRRYELSPKEIMENCDKLLEERRKEMRRHVRRAAKYGGTVPYSLQTLLEIGIGVGTIRKVYRNREAPR